MTRQSSIQKFSGKTEARLCSELSALICSLPRRVCGVDLRLLLGPARKVHLAALPDDDKVKVERQRILLDPCYVTSVYDAGDEARRAACALYFLHELTHLAQGIGPKAMVRLLRRADGEQTLLHCDLHADHVAAAILHRAVPRWSVPFLKDVQGHALAAFPATRRHSPKAQHRKRMRVLAVRADYWARRLGLIAAERAGDGYLFIEYTRPHGAMLLFRSGPPLTLLGEVRLGPGMVMVLEQVNAPGASQSLAELDDVLIGALLRLRA
jgi:hypothetical protein